MMLKNLLPVSRLEVSSATDSHFRGHSLSWHPKLITLSWITLPSWKCSVAKQIVHSLPRTGKELPALLGPEPLRLFRQCQRM